MATNKTERRGFTCVILERRANLTDGDFENDLNTVIAPRGIGWEAYENRLVGKQRDFWSDFGEGFLYGFTETANIAMGIAGTAASAYTGRPIRSLTHQRDFWNDLADFGEGFVYGFTETANIAAGLAGTAAAAYTGRPFRSFTDQRDFYYSDFGEDFLNGFTQTANLAASLAGTGLAAYTGRSYEEKEDFF